MIRIRQFLMVLVLVAAAGCRPWREPSHDEFVSYLKTLPATGDLQDSQLIADDALLDECDAILSDLAEKGLAAAFKRIRRLSPLSTSELKELEDMTREQLAAVRPRFGDIIGYERISSRQMGNSVTECVYITKCEKHILRWRFYFYKPRDKWVLNTFFWDDQIQEL